MTLGKRSRGLKAPVPELDGSVTTLELFFDLVFVFSITQLTGLILESDGADGYLQAGAVLIVTWWMYDGYAWLSNNVSPTTASTRIPMLVAMAGFLVMAIAVPTVFTLTGWQYAVSYLVIVVLHAWSFGRSSLGSSARAILSILPFNLAIAAFVILAAALDDDLRWIGWAGAVALILTAIATRSETGFALRPDHFAERHQLIIIIALGETIVATGVGAGSGISENLVLAAVLGSIVLVSSLWWIYFGGDDVAGVEVLTSLEGPPQTRAAFWAYSIIHTVHIFGLVLVAAGLHLVVHHPDHALSMRMALTMGAGCAAYLVAQGWFRRWLDFASPTALIAGAVVCLVVAPVGNAVSGIVELALLAAVVALTLVTRHRIDARGQVASEQGE